MTKLKIELDTNQKKLLKNILSDKRNASSSRAKKKARVILLRAQGKTIQEISSETNLSERTIKYYIKNYITHPVNGIRFIHQNNYKKSRLEKYKSELCDEFKENPPYSYKDATVRINTHYNITISESAVRRFLNKNNIYTDRSRSRKNKSDRT